jgi:hypothetical protein
MSMENLRQVTRRAACEATGEFFAPLIWIAVAVRRAWRHLRGVDPERRRT